MALTASRRSESGKRKAVFFDKDGTLIVNVPYNVDPRLIRFAKGAAFCLKLLHAAGYGLVIVTNQSGVARGYYTEESLAPMRERIARMFETAAVPLLGLYYCPHHPEGIVPGYAVSCVCRKPAPGLLNRAAIDHRIDLSRSWMVGDILDDVEAGFRAGCRTVLLANGGETEWRFSPGRAPNVFADNLAQAALAIVAASSATAAPLTGGSA